MSARQPVQGEAAILHQAARWMSLQASGDASARDIARRDAWRAADPRHEAAWQCAEQVMRRLGALPAPLAGPVLGRPRVSRRAALGSLLGLAVAVPLGVRAYRWQRGDLHTAAGGSQQLALADGSRLRLDTATRVRSDLLHEPAALHVLEGRIQLQRPAACDDMVVHTPHGRVEVPAASCVVVEARAAYASVAVLDGTARVVLQAMDAALALQAGQRSRFQRTTVEAPAAVLADDSGWLEGLLHAEDERLDEFLVRLGRYQPGWLGCDARSAGRRISGVFRLQDPARVVDVVARTLQLQVRRWGPLTRLQDATG